MDRKESSPDILRNSRFLHLFQKNDAICLQHNLTLKKVYGNKALKVLYEIFREPKHIDDAVNCCPSEYSRAGLKSTIESLVEKGMLVSDNDIDLALYMSLFEMGMKRYPIQTMYLIPANDCNFRCTYCFFIENQHKPFNNAYLSLDNAKRGLDLFAKLTENANEIAIVYYGGEPLLNAEVVYASMRYVRHLEAKGTFKSPVRLTIITNGSLVDNRTVEEGLANRASISVSLDGPQPFHDAARKGMAGHGTFQQALAGFRRLQAGGVNTAISCTLNQFTIQHIDEITEFIIKDLQPEGMGFNILAPTFSGKKNPDYDYEFAALQLIRAFKMLREHGIYEGRIMRRIKPYVENGFHLKDCDGVGGQIVLTPEGRIGPCQEFLGLDEFFPLTVDGLYSQLPSITSEDIYREPLFDEWRHRFPLNMAGCADCFAIAVCGGGCAYAAYINHGTIWEIDESVCYQSKHILEWMIWDTYEHLMAAEAL